MSHLRFGKEKIRSEYLIFQADYVACHLAGYVKKYDMARYVKPSGIFVLNCPWTDAELDGALPARVKRELCSKGAQLWAIDASAIADAAGLGKRINTVMQAAFFRLSGVLPFEQALHLLKESVRHTYKIKGEAVVDMNIQAIDKSTSSLHRVAYPAGWAEAVDDPAALEAEARLQAEADVGLPDFVRRISRPSAVLEGDSLPVSAFVEGDPDPLGLTKYEEPQVVQQPKLFPEEPIKMGEEDQATAAKMSDKISMHQLLLLQKDADVAMSAIPLQSSSPGAPCLDQHSPQVSQGQGLQQSTSRRRRMQLLPSEQPEFVERRGRPRKFQSLVLEPSPQPLKKRKVSHLSFCSFLEAEIFSLFTPKNNAHRWTPLPQSRQPTILVFRRSLRATLRRRKRKTKSPRTKKIQTRRRRRRRKKRRRRAWTWTRRRRRRTTTMMMMKSKRVKRKVKRTTRKKTKMGQRELEKTRKQMRRRKKEVHPQGEKL